MLDRAAFALLHLDDRPADEPEILALGLGAGNRRVAYDALFRCPPKNVDHQAVEITRAREFYQHIPRCCLGKGLAHLEMFHGELEPVAREQLDGRDTVAALLSREDQEI